MTIQINTDNNINGSEVFMAPFITQIKVELSRFSSHIKRIEAHLSDEIGTKDGFNDIRCLLEARLEGKQPIAVSNQANSVDQALSGALNKLTLALEHVMEDFKNH